MMDVYLPTSPTNSPADLLKSSSSSTKLVDDVTSLTSFNPFSEEDEHDQSSYTLVSSLFSKVKNSFASPLSSAVAAAASASSNVASSTSALAGEQKRTYERAASGQSSTTIVKASVDKFRPKIAGSSGPSLAPPLVSAVPALSETPTYNTSNERTTNNSGLYNSPIVESYEGGIFGTAIPGFPIQDDARSIHTTTSLKRSASVSKVIRRIRGEGISRDYWMDDENCKECYDCKSVFTAWRRKHHCRICGQIFCSRCASNIIKGSRFGQEGMLRVCKLCLDKLHNDEDDDDDRRSIISTISSAYPYSAVDSSSLTLHSQSPFAASQLFGRTDEPYNLYSIAETRRQRIGSDGSGIGSRPLTPGEFENGVWDASGDAHLAPFRRVASEDEKDPLILGDSFTADQSPLGPHSGSKTPTDLQIAVPFPVTGSQSTIQFPGSSPEHAHGLDSPRPPSLFRSRVSSYADTDASTPFLRSRVHSRLTELSVGEAGWRTRRESTAYAQELNTISMFHLRIMLRQMLTTEGISNVREWEETLLKLALRIAKDLTFTAYPYREGADMDVRRYVKIKKIPGGSPKDSEYVDGAVITKNVAHKQMSRSQKNPRIMFVTFPLEFQRVEGQYMHFGQIVRQEKEYLGNLASRIAALRPHIVLVEKSVSRLALESLAKQNIVVARTVKKSAIQFVARMTGGDVFSSMDKLAFEPRLGHCRQFRIQTFDHPLIPSRRKTYMRFEGCSRDLGCTIILRGGDMDHLKRVKKVTLFLTFIVRNLKLETHLWKDSVITAPHLTVDAAPQAYLTQSPHRFTLQHPLATAISTDEDVSYTTASDQSFSNELLHGPLNEEEKALRLSRRIHDSLEPYLKTFISVSATLRFPPPYPIWKMKELDDKLYQAQSAWEDEVIRREERLTPKHFKDITITPKSLLESTTDNSESILGQIEGLPSVLPETPTPDSGASSRTDESSLGSDYFTRRLATSASFTSLKLSESPLKPALAPEVFEYVMLKQESDIAAQSTLDLVKWQHNEQRRMWEWYLRKNNDDFIVDKYQCISMVEFTIPISELGHHRACFPPRLTYMTFYGQNDCTLGQFIEKAVHDTLVQFLNPKAICIGKGCDQPLARHCKVFVHNESRLLVYVEQWDGQIKSRLNAPLAPDLIATWSACRVCGSATPFIPVSEETQRYSFAKFLELHFYPADVQLVQGAGCIHNIYQHHIRYFAYRGMTVMFQTDPVTLYEVIYPPSRIHIKSESLLQIKNADYERLLKRNAQWYSALVDDLKLMNIDAASGDEEADAKLTAEINVLIERADSERAEMAKLIQEVYKDTSPVDTLALNRVRSERQDRIVAWQADFDKLPKPKLTQMVEKEGRRMMAFSSVRAMWPRRYEMPGVLENLYLPPINSNEEVMPTMRRVTGDSFSSIASTADASDAEISPKSVTNASPPVDPSPVGDQASTSQPQPPMKRDYDSDSTIAACRPDNTVGTDLSDLQSHDENSENEVVSPVPPMSRLPRRSGQHPSVAELVKRYQDFLPESISTELAVTAFPPKLPEALTEQDQRLDRDRTIRAKSKMKLKAPLRKESVSDFEHSYAANVAPRYLTRKRTPGGIPHGSRIPGPMPSSVDSRDSSRRTSPDKRPSLTRQGTEFTIRGGRSSPPLAKVSQPTSLKPNKPRLAGRNNPKDRLPPIRSASVSNVKLTMRRSSGNAGGGGKVSNIARHFERLHKDNERSNRRYAVIRGRRARPVASARATVEVFDSVKEAIKDESESSDSSSEADDEDEGDDEADVATKQEASAMDNVNGSSSTASAIPELQPQDHGKLDSGVVPPVTITPSTSTPPTELGPPSGSPPSTPLPPLLRPQTPSETPPHSDAETSFALDRPSTLMKALSGFWPQQAANARSLMDVDGDDPMADPEHIFRESSMVVRTDEPTSIIALALNSPQYRDMLSKSRAGKKQNKEPRLSEGGEAFMPDDISVADSSSTWGVVNVDSTDDGNPTDDLRTPSSKLPWAISFESGGLTISCTILYPEQFDALRRTYDCDKSLIESLARCVRWNASGGKSGSAFLKTRDDRFIAKELSRTELETMATFAPAYFDYMSSAVTADRPTLLAKVFGCYKLVFRKTAKDKERSSKSKSTQMNLLVMENLFYDRRFARIFDLKGSTRNRHVQSTGRENEVLLDENLVQTAHLNPFYVREHAKRIFRGALYNDTKFLADINVMDYSLIVGIDSVKNELVVGIVDYIRTYTWDKKLESWVKESAFLTGAGKGEPTIVTPKQYRQRFISAMERYFPLVPDRWMKQQDFPEEEGNSLLNLWPDW